MNHLYALIFALCIVAPVWAQDQTLKNPLSYSLREYGAIILIAMLGGFARWFAAVRRGKAVAYDLRVLVGEMFTSAFVGILIFWAGEAFNVHPLITAALAGMGGHMGISLLMWVERSLKKHFERKWGVSPDTDRAPLGDE